MAGPARDTFLHNAHYLRRTVRFDQVNVGGANGVEFDFKIPGGGFITGIDVQVVTAFNAGTSNDLTVGVPGTPNAYVATGQAIAGTAGMKKIPGPGRVAADTTVVAKYAQSGAAATAGEADIVIHYVPR